MNNTWKTHFIAVAWKELMEFWRRNKLLIPGTIVMISVLQYMTIAQIVNNKALNDVQKGAILGFNLMYLPLMVMPFIGSPILSRSLHEEKLKKSIHVLFASGLSRSAIWAGKFLIASIMSYVGMILTSVAYFIMVKVILGLSLTVNSEIMFVLLFVMPIACIGLLGLTSLAYWALRNALIVTVAFPMVSMLGSWNFIIQFGLKKPAPLVAIIALLFGVTAISLSVFGVSRLSKERITRL